MNMDDEEYAKQMREAAVTADQSIDLVIKSAVTVAVTMAGRAECGNCIFGMLVLDPEFRSMLENISLQTIMDDTQGTLKMICENAISKAKKYLSATQHLCPELPDNQSRIMPWEQSGCVH